MDKGKIENLLVNKSLYESINIDIEDIEELSNYFNEVTNLPDNINEQNEVSIESYCPECKLNRIFYLIDSKEKYRGFFGVMKNPDIDRRLRMTREDKFNKLINNRLNITFRCARSRDHMIYFDLLITKDKIIKIGQYPSSLDLKGYVFDRYDKILSKGQLKELRTAEILAAHGYGIGAFIHFRRIIEQIVQERFEEKINPKISDPDFQKKRFGEKIEYLRNDLPELLVNNANIYSIVSKGVHELNEDECLKMYPILRKGIELILDRVIEIKKKEQEEKEFTEMTGRLKGELKAPSK